VIQIRVLQDKETAMQMMNRVLLVLARVLNVQLVFVLKMLVQHMDNPDGWMSVNVRVEQRGTETAVNNQQVEVVPMEVLLLVQLNLNA
jgi:hypothetical protein